MSLAGKIAVVTGASRGIGQGIALQLGAAGATVYVTGRASGKSEGGGVLPTLEDTAKEVTARGGKGIAAFVDHSKAEEVGEFFARVKKETSRRLDLLVNNAYSAGKYVLQNEGKKFWELDPDACDMINNVGLRNHYLCSVHAARLMVPARQGLIVNISSAAGLRYFFNVPYGVGKEAMDRMSIDMAIELKQVNVAVVALWPGAVRTQLSIALFNEDLKAGGERAKRAQTFFLQFIRYAERGESIEYPGKAVVALASDPNKLAKTGRILITADLGRQYGFVDIDGRQPANLRSVSNVVEFLGLPRTASLIPSWIRIPGVLMHSGCSKF